MKTILTRERLSDWTARYNGWMVNSGIANRTMQSFTLLIEKYFCINHVLGNFKNVVLIIHILYKILKPYN